MRKAYLLIILVAAILSAWLTTLVDHGLGLDWPHVAVRNWEQYGIFTLHGKMVTNPGGFQAETAPLIYAGHRSTSLIPVFLCHRLFSAVGLNSLGFVAYYGAAAAMVLVSIWWLLGRTGSAFCVAVVAVLVPGFIRWQTSLDPNLAAALFGFPFCAAVVTLLRRPSLSWSQLTVLALLVVAYSVINWTTALVHAMLFVTLFAMGVPRRHLVIYTALAAVVAGWVLLSSVASKAASPPIAGAASTSLYSGYGWGNVGYGLGLTTTTAFSRLVTVNGLGLLPMLIALGYFGRWRPRQTLPVLLCLLPFMMVVIEVLALRNYFGHHPWMSVHFILLAIVLTAALGMDFAEATSTGGETRLTTCLVWLVLTTVYSTIVLFVGQARNERMLALADFIVGHTTRSTTIVIRRDTDPTLVDFAGRIANMVDRHVVVTNGPDDPILAASPSGLSVLSADHAITGKVLAQTGLETNSSPVVKSLITWYAGHIARRRPGDQLDIPGKTFFLNQLAY